MGSGSAAGFFFSCGEISAFFAKIFFEISVVILNSSLRYQIFEFDINIQILVWIIGSTYRKGEILKQKWHVNHQLYHCYTRCTIEQEIFDSKNLKSKVQGELDLYSLFIVLLMYYTQENPPLYALMGVHVSDTLFVVYFCR